MKLLSAFCILAMLVPTWAHSTAAPTPDWRLVAKRLKKAGLKTEFIFELREYYDPKPFTEVLELNTLLFLRKSDYHGIQVNDEAADDVRKFCSAHQKALRSAKKTYGVPGEVIASLLWMESRFGKNKGRFHVPSVFADLVQADRKDVVTYLHDAAKNFTHEVSRNDRHEIDIRAKKRVKWAINELKAVQEMWRRDKGVLGDFMGSFAGAFGMAQFEPSSYVVYARPAVKGQTPNLQNGGDAIQSVAFYLHKSGWRSQKPKSHVRALLRYNNSHDYANAILKLSQKATPREETSKRTPAGKK